MALIISSFMITSSLSALSKGRFSTFCDHSCLQRSRGAAAVRVSDKRGNSDSNSHFSHTADFVEVFTVYRQRIFKSDLSDWEMIWII